MSNVQIAPTCHTSPLRVHLAAAQGQACQWPAGWRWLSVSVGLLIMLFSASLATAEEVIDITPPTVPNGILLQAVSVSQAALAWDAASDDTAVTVYEILRDGLPVGVTASCSFIDGGLTTSAAYEYQVIAIDAAGNRSDPSAVLPVSTSDSAAPSLTITSNTTFAATDPALKMVDLTISGAVVTIEGTGLVKLNSLSLIGSAVLQHETTTVEKEHALRLLVLGSIVIDSNARIDVSGRGYRHGRTFNQAISSIPTTPANYRGGSYGGYGYHSNSIAPIEVYGDYADPNELGSGGGGNPAALSGWTGAGGGLIRLQASSLQLDGQILANGTPGVGGGSGSGGGIRIDVGSFTMGAASAVSAHGGAHISYTGGGGGGRIAVYHTSGSVDAARFGCFGGSASGSTDGGCGTIYIKRAGEAWATYVFRNNGNIQPLQVAATPWWFGERSIVSSAPAAVQARLVTDKDASWRSESTTSIELISTPSVSGRFVSPGDMESSEPLEFINATFSVRHLQGTHVTMAASAVRAVEVACTDLTLASNSSLLSYETTLTEEYSLVVQVSGLASIDATSRIDATGCGYRHGRTLNQAVSSIPTTTANFRGGSYGGYGYHSISVAPIEVYGDYADPNELGSGGGGNPAALSGWTGAGGGLIRLQASSLQLDGQILANGTPGVGGGSGSGGGIRIDVGSFTMGAASAVSAHGGAHISYTGGGGGGRIAIYYNAGTVPLDLLSAFGGNASGSTDGTCGTIFVIQNGSAFGSVIFDNNGYRPHSAMSATPLYYGDISLLFEMAKAPLDFTIIQRNNTPYKIIGTPEVFDADNDGLFGWEEYELGTDPRNSDTNGDGVPDRASHLTGLDPLTMDTDGDGLPNAVEVAIGTDPLVADTDGDGVGDATDHYPTDPSASDAPVADPGDTQAPVIQIQLPTGAVEL